MAPRHAITAEKRDRMLRALRRGATYRDAADHACIPWSTWMGWRNAVLGGRCDDPDVIHLVTAATETFAEVNIGLVESVAKHVADDWRAGAFLLQHRQGDPKARHDEKRARYEAIVARHRAEGTHVENVRAVEALTDEELDRRIAELEAARQPR